MAEAPTEIRSLARIQPERRECDALFRIVQFKERGAELQGPTADQITDVRDLTRQHTREALETLMSVTKDVVVDGLLREARRATKHRWFEQLDRHHRPTTNNRFSAAFTANGPSRRARPVDGRMITIEDVSGESRGTADDDN